MDLPGIAVAAEELAELPHFDENLLPSLIARLDEARASTSRQGVINAIASMIPTMNAKSAGAVSAA